MLKSVVTVKETAMAEATKAAKTARTRVAFIFTGSFCCLKKGNKSNTKRKGEGAKISLFIPSYEGFAGWKKLKKISDWLKASSKKSYRAAISLVYYRVFSFYGYSQPKNRAVLSSDWSIQQPADFWSWHSGFLPGKIPRVLHFFPPRVP